MTELKPEPSRSSGEAGVDPASLAGAIEAVLLSADRPVPALKLAAALKLIPDVPEDEAAEGAPASSVAPAEEVTEGPVKPKKSRRRAGSGDALAVLRTQAVESVRKAIGVLNEAYEQTGRSFRVESLAGGYRVVTLPAYADAIAAYHGARAKTALSPAALEALAIIAYKQPITRARLEAIRGVACGEILRSLLDRKMITITGRAEELGRPLLYGTSKRFLELFGLASLKDLPSVDELRAKG